MTSLPNFLPELYSPRAAVQSPRSSRSASLFGFGHLGGRAFTSRPSFFFFCSPSVLQDAASDFIKSFQDVVSMRRNSIARRSKCHSTNAKSFSAQP